MSKIQPPLVQRPIAPAIIDRQPTLAKRVVVACLVVGVPLAAIGAAFGFLLSQFMPLWGFFAQRSAPFSEDRLGGAVGHVLLLGGVGLAVGILCGVAWGVLSDRS